MQGNVSNGGVNLQSITEFKKGADHKEVATLLQGNSEGVSANRLIEEGTEGNIIVPLPFPVWW